MELEIRISKKTYNTWCLENNLNEKNKKTPLLFLKNKILNGSPTENIKKGNEIKNETLETINKMLENIDKVEIKTTKENDENVFNFTLNLEDDDETDKNKINENDYNNFLALCDLICDLYDAPKVNLKPLLKNKDLFNSLLGHTLGDKKICNKLVDIVTKAELALMILESNKKGE